MNETRLTPHCEECEKHFREMQQNALDDIKVTPMKKEDYERFGLKYPEMNKKINEIKELLE
jgi:hypothetical protein